MIITHRGLDPSRESFYTESTKEAFLDHLARGFGLEFDVQLTKDAKLIVSHDKNLTRLSKGIVTENIFDLTLSELQALRFNNCQLISLSDLLKSISERQSSSSISALHLKSDLQNNESLDILLTCLKSFDLSKFFIFNTTIKSASYLKAACPAIQLAPSVVHPYDQVRFNSSTGNTLLRFDEISEHLSLFSYMWLDEWDRMDRSGNSKELYTADFIKKIQDQGIKVAIVSPELHATSPSLQADESHPDACDLVHLEERLGNILKAKPDLICTDYPDKVFLLAKQLQ